ncbi:MAG: hypothetical protein AAF721_05905, partial [Myxococcota bacterium]
MGWFRYFAASIAVGCGSPGETASIDDAGTTDTGTTDSGPADEGTTGSTSAADTGSGDGNETGSTGGVLDPSGRAAVLVEVRPPTGGITQLFTYRLEGGVLEGPFTASDDALPAVEVSPDGRWFAYRRESAGIVESFAVHIAGAEVIEHPLSVDPVPTDTDTDLAHRPSFAPASDALAFDVGSGPDRTLFYARLEPGIPPTPFQVAGPLEGGSFLSTSALANTWLLHDVVEPTGGTDLYGTAVGARGVGRTIQLTDAEAFGEGPDRPRMLATEDAAVFYGYNANGRQAYVTGMSAAPEVMLNDEVFDPVEVTDLELAPNGSGVAYVQRDDDDDAVAEALYYVGIDEAVPSPPQRIHARDTAHGGVLIGSWSPDGAWLSYQYSISQDETLVVRDFYVAHVGSDTPAAFRL